MQNAAELTGDCESQIGAAPLSGQVAFNRVIAKQLKAAVDKVLAGSPHTLDPVIRTVHALCIEVIGEDIRLLLDHEREAMLYDVLVEHSSIGACCCSSGCFARAPSPCGR